MTCDPEVAAATAAMTLGISAPCLPRPSCFSDCCGQVCKEIPPRVRDSPELPAARVSVCFWLARGPSDCY
jgi:hypothetical protein